MLKISVNSTLTLLSVVLMVGATGCGSLTGHYRTANDSLDTRQLEAAGYSFDESGAQLPGKVAPSSSGLPTVVLDIRNGDRHMERIPISPDKPLFIQDVVKDAKLTNRLGKIRVSIMRATTPNKPPVRMDVDFDSSGQNVMQEQNYALQPNDQIIVSKDDTTWLENMIGNASKNRKRPGT